MSHEALLHYSSHSETGDSEDSYTPEHLREKRLEAQISLLRDSLPAEFDHSREVQRIAVALAEAAELTPEQINIVYYAGILHDIGKLDIDKSLLNFPGSYSPQQREDMKQHVKYGFDRIHPIDPAIAKIVGMHHLFQTEERRYGFVGSEPIYDTDLILAQIIACADMAQALLDPKKNRSYKNQWDSDITLNQLISLFPECMSQIAVSAGQYTTSPTVPHSLAES